MLECDKTDLKNQVETLRTDMDDLFRKYNESVSESQRKVRLQDHLNQIGDLKRKTDEMAALHAYEISLLRPKLDVNYLDNIYLFISEFKHFKVDILFSNQKTLEAEKKELSIQNTNLSHEVKKLSAENKVLDKALK